MCRASYVQDKTWGVTHVRGPRPPNPPISELTAPGVEGDTSFLASSQVYAN